MTLVYPSFYRLYVRVMVERNANTINWYCVLFILYTFIYLYLLKYDWGFDVLLWMVVIRRMDVLLWASCTFLRLGHICCIRCEIYSIQQEFIIWVISIRYLLLLWLLLLLLNSIYKAPFLKKRSKRCTKYRIHIQ